MNAHRSHREPLPDDVPLDQIRILADKLLELDAEHWLSTPQRHLGSRIPHELLTTPEGRLEVYRALLRIEHGVFG